MSQLFQQFQSAATQAKGTLAIIEAEVQWTYSEMLNKAQRLATAFEQQGVVAGERVGVMLYNQKEFFLALLALRQLGAVVVPINIQMLPKDIAYVIQNAGIRRMVIDEGLLPQLQAFPLSFIVVNGQTPASGGFVFHQLIASHEPRQTVELTQPKDLAFLIYTSGTTGNPKGVMLSEHNILTNRDGFKAVLEINSDDRLVMALPLFHAYGLIVALTALLAGAQMTLIPKFHPKKIVEALVEQQATVLPLVPTLFSVILGLVENCLPIKKTTLRYCISGGAALPLALHQQIEAVLKAPVLEGYGLTETSPVVSVNSLTAGINLSSVGKVLPNVQVQITNTEGQPCPVGEEGEIWVKGDHVMMGYYQQPESTQAVMTPEGWFKTGDLGRLDEQGFLYISGGRIKDLIIKAGENISPKTIEEILYHHPAVREAAVVGLPHPKLGEDIMAFVSLKEGQTATSSELIQYCRKHLSPTYQPAAIEILDDLPKNATGKIMKKLLKERLAATNKTPSVTSV